MLTRFRFGSNGPPERLNIHVSPISPLPKSYTDACNDPNWKNCIVCCMWLFHHKYLADGTLSRYKARLVANGSTQLEATSQHWLVHQLNVKNAFLHGGLSDTVYMHQPPGFRDYAHPNYVITLLHQEVSMTDLGLLSISLGIFVTRDSSGMLLSQRKYATEILERAYMVNCNPSRTSADTES
ncbi:ribonuclease H-like domain-containing protein [Tanacetum coccineum]